MSRNCIRELDLTIRKPDEQPHTHAPADSYTMKIRVRTGNGEADDCTLSWTHYVTVPPDEFRSRMSQLLEVMLQEVKAKLDVPSVCYAPAEIKPGGAEE